jgi:uncharacterized tellurite resistance protein B-like protein
MLKKIQAFFDAEESDDVDDEAALHLAAAVLLIEVAKSDHVVRDMQVEQLKDVLKREWALDDSDLSDLLNVARDAAEAHASLYEQVALVNRNFSPQQKFNLVRGLWEVAYANGELHHHEELLIRRLADLMYVSHTDFIRSKHRVLEARGIR